MSSTVVIDAGHGGHDSGATGPNGLLEKEVNLVVARHAAAFLEAKGVDVVMTRRTDSFVTLGKRSRISNEVNPGAFVSIHANSYQGRARGFECFTSRGATEGDRLAATLLDSYESAFPALTNRGAKEAGFSVLTSTRAPAALFELDFIDHPQGEEFLAEAGNRKVMGKAIGVGVLNFLRPGGSPDPLRASLLALRAELDAIIAELS